MVNILKNIYSDSHIATTIGFKGGTAAYLFYDLPRFSVDLDFDLLKQDQTTYVFERIHDILMQEGTLKDSVEKHYTLFYLLQTAGKDWNIKIEISKRPTVAEFCVQSYLGIPILVMNKPDMAASKLSAFLMRKTFAARDMYDLWFFMKSAWGIRKEVVEEKSAKTIRQALTDAIEKTEAISGNQLLQGMGELLNEDQKIWVRKNLREELIFQLRLSLESL